MTKQASTDELVSNNVRAELARRRMSTSSLVPVLGVDVRAIQRRLAGEKSWTLTEMQKVATFLNVPLSTLLADALEGQAAA